jgi:hypothetical protein
MMDTPQRQIGVESAHGMGDGLFNAALIRALSTRYDLKIGVAVRPHCKDAFYNLPWVDEIVEIQQMNQGEKVLQNLGYKRTIQITQNVKFFEFRKSDPDHSLIDTPLLTGRQLGLPDFDQRPLFYPTSDELASTDSIFSDQPTIAIESVFTSGQSWANEKAIAAILDKYLGTHRVLWLSNIGAPNHPQVDNLLRYTRRQAIMCLRACDILFSVGSCFFCASMALPKGMQPTKIVCLWKDEFYKYERPLTQHQWHKDIIWTHNQEELQQFLTS